MNEKQPYPEYLERESYDKQFLYGTETAILSMMEEIDIVTEIPLKVALLSILLEKKNLWQSGVRTGVGFWFSAKALTFPCCEKVNAPTWRNPLGMKRHTRTKKHILNLLSTIFKMDKKEILKEIPEAKMIFAMDSKLKEELQYRIGR
jgi:hypothetical protein